MGRVGADGFDWGSRVGESGGGRGFTNRNSARPTSIATSARPTDSNIARTTWVSTTARTTNINFARTTGQPLTARSTAWVSKRPRGPHGPGVRLNIGYWVGIFWAVASPAVVTSECVEGCASWVAAIDKGRGLERAIAVKHLGGHPVGEHLLPIRPSAAAPCGGGIAGSICRKRDLCASAGLRRGLRTTLCGSGGPGGD